MSGYAGWLWTYVWATTRRKEPMRRRSYAASRARLSCGQISLSYVLIGRRSSHRRAEPIWITVAARDARLLEREYSVFRVGPPGAVVAFGMPDPLGTTRTLGRHCASQPGSGDLPGPHRR